MAYLKLLVQWLILVAIVRLRTRLDQPTVKNWGEIKVREHLFNVKMITTFYCVWPNVEEEDRRIWDISCNWMQTIAANSAGSIISFTNQKEKINKTLKNLLKRAISLALFPRFSSCAAMKNEKVNCCPHETILSNSSLVLRLSPHATTKEYASYGVHVVGPLLLWALQLPLYHWLSTTILTHLLMEKGCCNCLPMPIKEVH